MTNNNTRKDELRALLKRKNEIVAKATDLTEAYFTTPKEIMPIARFFFDLQMRMLDEDLRKVDELILIAKMRKD